MKGRSLRLVWCVLLACSSISLQAQLTIHDTLTTAELLETLFGQGVTVSNITTTCDTSVSMMEFNGTSSNLGLATGVIISSGNAMDAVGPNTSGSTTTGVGTPGDSLLTDAVNDVITNAFDACVIRFDITPLCDTIGINYVFASEEYPEFAPPNSSSFNDVFGFFIEGPGYPNATNIALIPGTPTPVSINNLNAVTNQAFYVDNVGGATVEYDGFTTPLLASAIVQSCETYTITIAIQDMGDGAWDSSVFLEAGGIGCVSPVLQLNAINSTQLGSNVAVEGCVNFGVFTFQLDAPLPDTTIFYYTIGGTAIPGLDYAPFQDSIIMPAGQVSIDLPVAVIPDGLIEGTETIEIYYVDSSLCANQIYYDTAIMEIWDEPDVPEVEDVSMCSEDTIQIGGLPVTGQSYIWTPTTGLSSPFAANPSLTLTNNSLQNDTLMYYLVIDAFSGFCIYEDSVQVIVRPEIQGNFDVDPACFGYPNTFVPTVLGDSLMSWEWTFGDGGEDSIESPLYTYGLAGSYQASLIVENVWGCRDTSFNTVLVNPLPVVNFSAPPVCHEDVTTFSNSTQASVSYLWELGDGSTSFDESPIYVYPDPGSYSVLLTATTPPGCVDSLRREVEVYANPVADFDATSECFETATQFTNLSQPGTGQSLTYNWSYGDGNNSAETSPGHVYPNFGNYGVGLTVTDEFGCTAATNREIVVYALPIASFEADSVCTKSQWDIVVNSSVPDGSEIFRYFWEYGDGRTSTNPDPEVIFHEPGTYEVSLKVVTEHGCPDSITQSIGSYPLPFPFFAFDPACELDSATFFNQSRVTDTIFEDVIQTLRWEWGDGSGTGNLENPRHLYAADGTYLVELTAWTDKGCEASRGREVVAFPIPDEPELVGDTVCWGDQAFVTAIPGSHTARLDWFMDLADETPFQEGFTYTTPPVVYDLTYHILATSDKGCELGPLPVVVAPFEAKEAAISLSASVVEIPQAIVNFGIAANVEIARVSWNLGDGTTSEGLTPVHEYEFPGKYPIQVQLTDVYGCEYELKDLVEVKQVIEVHIPTAFSPNEDGINDEFYLGYHLIRSMNFQVFNRWGQKVFESDNLDFRWDGRSLKGNLLNEGVYMYQMNARDIHGNLMLKSGSITLFR
ncbi:MAG: PKD domain-containing protein [Bacteroidota bacterium]